jgi:hypothetical protein
MEFWAWDGNSRLPGRFALEHAHPPRRFMSSLRIALVAALFLSPLILDDCLE